LEDLYAPYKAKKKSKGMMAKEAGLEPLSQIILTSPKTKAELKAEFGDKFNKPEMKLILLRTLTMGHLTSLSK